MLRPGAEELGYSKFVVTPAAPVPPPFERIGARRFSFYPPIQNAPANEWTYRAASWSEILVRNTATCTDLWISRRWLGGIYETGHEVAVVALLGELEYREGSVRPYRSRVIEMPGPHPPPELSLPLVAEKRPLAPVISIRLETRHENRVSRLIEGAIALGVLGCLALAGYSLQGGERGRRAVVATLGETYLALTGSDTFQTAVRSLGAPATDRVVLVSDGHRLRLAAYPDRGFRAVFLADPAEARGLNDHYIGAVDEDGRVLQSVPLPQGGTSDKLLRLLENF